jgi:hypothetical protein
LQLAFKKKLNFPTQEKKLAAAWLIHPGHGKITHLEGWETLKNIPQIYDYKCRMKVGDIVSPRLGSGEFRAHVFFEGDNETEIVTALEQAKKTVKIIQSE